MIHGIFKVDYAKTAVADRQALARKLLAEAASTNDDPAARYMLLTDALDLASVGGDADTAIKAAIDLDRYFPVDPMELKRTALVRAATAAATPEANESLSRHCLDVADAAALADAFETVQQLANLAEAAANKTRKVAFVASIQVRLADLRGLAAEFPQVKLANALLEKTPDDPEAHLALGRFYALHKGQWAIGLPHLAAGSDAALRALATRELAAPVDGLDQAALGDTWWDIAEKATGLTRTHARAHAATWYERSKKSLSGITLTRIQSRLQSAAGGAPSTAPAPLATVANGKNTVNLLGLLDPAKDAGEGSWKMENNALVVAEGKYATLQLPYFLPEEYDLRVNFTRVENSGPIAVLLAAHNRTFGFELDLKGEARFERVANKISKDNPTTVAVAVSNGRKYSLTIQIRNDGITALLDGTPLTQWKTDYKDLSRYSLWKLSNDKLCGLGANNAKVTFHAVELVEITGAGKPIR